jgi:hypothetical protein
MQETKKKCLQFACYAGALVISLGLQVAHPDLFAILCTPLPIGEMLNPQERLAVPLNSPVLPAERIK